MRDLILKKEEAPIRVCASRHTTGADVIVYSRKSGGYKTVYGLNLHNGSSVMADRYNTARYPVADAGYGTSQPLVP